MEEWSSTDSKSIAKILSYATIIENTNNWFAH